MPEGGCDPVKDHHICEELQPVGRACVREVWGERFPMGGTPHWSRRSRDAPETCGEDDGEEQLPAVMED